VISENKRTEEWRENVTGRLEYARDLPHTKCSIHFETGWRILVKYRTLLAQAYRKGRLSSRSADTDFQHVMAYLKERVNDQVTFSDLVRQIQDFCRKTTKVWLTW